MSKEAAKQKILSLLADNKIGLEEAQSLLDTMREIDYKNEPIAVVSMALRFPGANSPEELWDLLINKRDLVSVFPQKRFDLVVNTKKSLWEKYKDLRDRLESDPRSFGAWLSDIDQFEPEAFGLSDHEARLMGPVERIFLSVSMEAISKAGYQKEQLQGSNTGVFVAHTPHPPFDYLNLFDEIDERAFISNLPANLGYHLAYALDFHGPVLTVNTTCSSSLAAIHVAKNALRMGDCDLAIVGGVNLVLFPYWENEAPDYVVRSSKYRCASYDDAADGIIGGEGIAVIVLKRLSDALRDKDYIHAVIKGSGMSSDGTSNGMHVPNPDAQARAIVAALKDASVSAETIGYVEGHGAGTQLGDLVEVDGLTRAFRQFTDAKGFCRLGSIKSNIGHLGDAAGLAGLIKAILCLENKEIPGIVHFQKENQKIHFEDTPYVVSGESSAWETSPSYPRRAGVNSIGISGTNVHVILEEFTSEESVDEKLGIVPVLFSADSRWALWELLQSMTKKIRQHINWKLSDIIHTVNYRRKHKAVRIGIFASSTVELYEKLERLLQVRTFERVPETFILQGIFIADEEETRQLSLTRFHQYQEKVDQEYLALMKRFIQGEEIEENYLRPFKSGNLLPLPVPPYKTRSIWPVNGQSFERDVSDLFFQAEWKPIESLKASKLSIQPNSVWMLLAREEDQVLSIIRERLSSAGARVIYVTPGEKFTKISQDVYHLPVNDLQAYKQLFQSLGKESIRQLTGILHGFTLKKVDLSMETLEGLEKSQDEGVFSLFCLVKTILEHHVDHPFQITVVSSGTEQVLPEENCVPARVTSFGLAKVVSQECPTISTFAIDCDLSEPDKEIAEKILSEILSDPRTRRELVAYRNGLRYTKLVERQPDNKVKEIKIREGGTYVIAGGTGYLGMQVGQFLSKAAKVNIVLLARNPLPDRSQWQNILENAKQYDEMLIYKIKEIMAMEELGSTVEMMCCDVMDPSSVAKTFQAIREKYGQINGCFMLVKQLFHLWLHELNYEQFKVGIYNRVKGTWLIEREIRSDKLDFFILFSSISSLMGTKSASECCSVNQYLDAMGGYLNSKGTPCYVLNLTLILDDKKDFGSKTPIPPIDFIDFQSALKRFFRNGQTWSLVSRFDLQEVHFLKPVLKIPFGPNFWQEVEQFVKEHKLLSQDKEEEIKKQEELDREEIKKRLSIIWNKVLGVEEIHGDSNFFNEGGTSLSALRFVKLFRDQFTNLSFEVADLYSMPTLDAQVDYVESQLGTKDALDEIFDALEDDDISIEEAISLLRNSNL